MSTPNGLPPWQCQQDAAEDWPFNRDRIVHARTTCAADSLRRSPHTRWSADGWQQGRPRRFNMRSSAVPRSCAPPLLNLAAAAVQADPARRRRNRAARARTIVVIGAVIESTMMIKTCKARLAPRALKWTMEARLTIHAASVEARTGACIRRKKSERRRRPSAATQHHTAAAQEQHRHQDLAQRRHDRGHDQITRRAAGLGHRHRADESEQHHQERTFEIHLAVVADGPAPA